MSSKTNRRSAQQRRAQAEAQARASAAANQARRKRLVAWVLILALGLAGVGSVIAIIVSGGTDNPAQTVPSPETITLPTSLPDGDPGYVLRTSAGDLEVELYSDAAPIAVGKMLDLAQNGFFDGNSCHRLTTYGEVGLWDTMKVLQCGSHDGTGYSDPNQAPWGPIENAPQADVYLAGSLAMARVGGDANSMTSQFFIVFEDSYIPSDQAGGYTVIGKVVAGLDQIRAVGDAGVTGGGSDGAPVTPVVIEGVDIP